jgi:hypothetical protein
MRVSDSVVSLPIQTVGWPTGVTRTSDGFDAQVICKCTIRHLHFRSQEPFRINVLGLSLSPKCLETVDLPSEKFCRLVGGAEPAAVEPLGL